MKQRPLDRTDALKALTIRSRSCDEAHLRALPPAHGEWGHGQVGLFVSGEEEGLCESPG